MTNTKIANDLVDRFKPYTKDLTDAKESALICLDELKDASLSGYDYDRESELPYYEELIKAIKNMPSGMLHYMDVKYKKDEKY